MKGDEYKWWAFLAFPSLWVPSWRRQTQWSRAAVLVDIVWVSFIAVLFFALVVIAAYNFGYTRGLASALKHENDSTHTLETR